MLAIRHALAAALVMGATLAPASADAQIGSRGGTVERRDSDRDRCGTIADRTRRAGQVILNRDGTRRTTRSDDCRVDPRRDDRRDGRVDDRRDCGIIIIGDRRDCRIDDRRRDDRRRDGRVDDRGRRVKRGPAFCRSGAGHPVHGRRWCRQKGYELGRDRRDRRYDDRYCYDRRDRRYDYDDDYDDDRRDRRYDYDDDRRRDRRDRRYDCDDRYDRDIFRIPSTRRRGVLDRRDLISILGSRRTAQIERFGSQVGLRGDLRGRWYRDRWGRDALLISAGGRPLVDVVPRGSGFILEFRRF